MNNTKIKTRQIKCFYRTGVSNGFLNRRKKTGDPYK